MKVLQPLLQRTQDLSLWHNFKAMLVVQVRVCPGSCRKACVGFRIQFKQRLGVATQLSASHAQHLDLKVEKESRSAKRKRRMLRNDSFPTRCLATTFVSAAAARNLSLLSQALAESTERCSLTGLDYVVLDCH